MTSRGYRVLFVGNVLKDGHTEYQIKVTDSQEQSWFVHKRYREIRELHDHMRLRLPDQISWFPPKRFFGNTHSKFIEERQKELQRYMQHMLSLDPTCQIRVLRKFLEIPARPVHGSHPIESRTQRLVRYVKNNLLDLSQPTEQFLDLLEQEGRERTYKALLQGQKDLTQPTGNSTYLEGTPQQGESHDYEDRRNENVSDRQFGTAVLRQPIDPHLLAVVKPSQLPKFYVPVGEQMWESTILAQSATVSGQGTLVYSYLKELIDLNDVKRRIDGIHTLRAKFPGIEAGGGGEAVEVTTAVVH